MIEAVLVHLAACLTLLLAAPDCALAKKSTPQNTTQSSQVNIDGHDNDPALLFFFSPETPGAAAAAQVVRQIRRDYSASKLAVLGIVPPGLADKPLAQFLKSAGINFPVVQDKDYSLARQCDVSGLPFLVVLDKNHKIADWWPGYHPAYDAMVRRSLKSALR